MYLNCPVTYPEGTLGRKGIWLYQASGQTLNTVGAMASIGGTYTYISLYTYIMLYYTYTVYMYYVSVNVQSAFLRTKKISTLITLCAL